MSPKPTPPRSQTPTLPHPLQPRSLRLLLLVGLVVTSAAAAQPFARDVAPFPVVGEDGRSYDHPMLGGFNIPRPQFVDIDGDGDLDLFVQERTDELVFFENVGTARQADFVWRTDAFADLEIGEWVRFADMDADGDLDVFAEQPFSLIRYYRNDGTPQTPRFTLAAATLRDTSGDFIFSDRQNIPAFADLDCDGDLDLYIASLAGTLSFYENLGLGPDGVPTFAFVTNRYENIEIIGGQAGGQTSSTTEPTRPFTSSRIPPMRDAVISSRAKAAMPQGARSPRRCTPRDDKDASCGRSGEKVLHGANAITFADVDEDGDGDLIWGDFFTPSLYFIENTGTCAAPALRLQSDTFPLRDPVMTSGYNVSAFADIDADGDLDLFVGVLGGAFGAAQNLVENFLFMEQHDHGYVLQTRRFIGQIDVGDESVPAFGDLDADGDLDLFIGNKIDPAAPQRATLTFFENTGTTTAPAFQRVTTDFIDLGTAFNAAPALADLDADGDLDLLVGGFNGAVAYYRNDGTPQAPDFTLAEPRLVNLRDTGSSGSLATPALADLDADGDLDLIVGENAGTLNYYRNDGTPQSPSFTLVTEALADLDLGSRTVPALTDWDHDGDFDLIVGTERDGLVLLRNDGTPQAPVFVRAATPELPSSSVTLLAPRLVDLDGDGDEDLVLGTRGGGLRYYENLAVGTATDEPVALPRFSLRLLPAYPNPFTTATTLRFQLDQADAVTLTVHDALGREVVRLLDAPLPPGEHTVPFEAEALPPGVYFYTVATRTGARATGQVLRLR